MNKASYYEQLKDPRWQKKRLEIMNRANFKCEECENSENMLSVHHGYYDNSLMLWEYDNDTLHCLCPECHEMAHAFRSSIYENIAKLSVIELEHLMVTLNDNSENREIIEKVIKEIIRPPCEGITKNNWQKLIAKSKNPTVFLRQNFNAIEADMKEELANT